MTSRLKEKNFCWLEEGIDKDLLMKFGYYEEDDGYLYHPLFDTNPKVMAVFVKKPKHLMEERSKSNPYKQTNEISVQMLSKKGENPRTQFKYSEFEKVLSDIVETKRGKYYYDKYDWGERYKKLWNSGKMPRYR